MIILNYIIKNHKNVYIRLNKNGAPVICTENDKTIFEYSKGKNILDSMPKTLKRLNFKLDPVLQIQTESTKKNTEKKVLEGGNYIVSEEIQQWVEKFGICDDILNEARDRREELRKALSDIDKEFINIIHEIEFEGKIDLYGGWNERNKVKENREKQRCIKNEILVLSSVLKMDFRNLDREIIDKVVTGLTKRKFTYRVVEEEDDTENVM